MERGIAPDRNEFWHVPRSDTCDSIAQDNDITVQELLQWKPAMNPTNCDKLVLNTYVCVGVGNSATSSNVPLTTRTSIITNEPSSGTGRPSSTTSFRGSVSTPVPVQPGMTDGCRRFYLAKSGDGCWAIANSAGIDLNDFYIWNLAVRTDCSALWLDYWYCIGTSGPQTTVSSGPPVPT